MTNKTNEIQKLNEEIKTLLSYGRNLNIDTMTNEEVLESINQIQLNKQKIYYRQRKINLLEGFAPSSI